MKNYGFENNEDFFGFVTAMSSHLLELGFEEAHQELSRALRTTWTKSSEVFGELWLASKKIMRRDGKRLPPCLKEDLEKCLLSARVLSSDRTRIARHEQG